MRYWLTFTLLIVSIAALAQEPLWDSENDSIQYYQAELAITHSNLINSVAPVDSLLKSNQITIDKHLAKLYFYKANFLNESYELTYTNQHYGADWFEEKVKEVLEYYDLAIEKADCAHLTEYEHGKYIFLFELIGAHEDELDAGVILKYKAIKSHLIEKGLKPDRFGLGATLDFHVGRDQWIGGAIALFQEQTPYLKYKTVCNGIKHFYKAEDIGFGLNALAFGYAYSLESQVHDFSLNLLELLAPFKITPAKFGFYKGPKLEKSNFYYRPGIGLGFSFFSVSYSYNVMFKKSVRASSEKVFLTIEINYPITNHINESRSVRTF